MVNSRLLSAPWLGRWCPAAADSWRGWLSPACPTCGLPVSGPWRRMQVSRWWAGWPPGRVWLALGTPEFGAVTTRMGFGMRTPLAEVPALLIRGRGQRRRLALLLGLAEATAAVPGEAEPTSNDRLIESWCSYQPKHGGRGGHHQQSSRHGRPLPACCRAVTRPESPIGEPGGATARLAAIGVSGWTRPSRVSSPRPTTTTISTSTSSFRRGWMRSPQTEPDQGWPVGPLRPAATGRLAGPGRREAGQVDRRNSVAHPTMFSSQTGPDGRNASLF